MTSLPCCMKPKHICRKISVRICWIIILTCSNTHLPGSTAKLSRLLLRFCLPPIYAGHGSLWVQGIYRTQAVVSSKPAHAVRTLAWLMENKPIPLNLASLPGIFEKLIDMPKIRQYDVKHETFTVPYPAFLTRMEFPRTIPEMEAVLFSTAGTLIIRAVIVNIRILMAKMNR